MKPNVASVSNGVLICWAMYLLPGCWGGSSSIPNLIPCRGTITLDGTPLDQGTVSFCPVDAKGGRSAVGQIDNGRFQMKTTASDFGALIGEYKIRVESREASKPGEATNSTPRKSLIPLRYGNPETSGLEVEVKKGMPSVELELESGKS